MRRKKRETTWDGRWGGCIQSQRDSQAVAKADNWIPFSNLGQVTVYVTVLNLGIASRLNSSRRAESIGGGSARAPYHGLSGPEPKDHCEQI